MQASASGVLNGVTTVSKSTAVGAVAWFPLTSSEFFEFQASRKEWPLFLQNMACRLLWKTRPEQKMLLAF